METLEIVFANGTPGRLTEDGGVLTVVSLVDGSPVTPQEAGTLYVLQAEGTEPALLVGQAQAAGYRVEVQTGETLTLPTAPAPAPEPSPRRRSN